jgi:hypothetical protein
MRVVFSFLGEGLVDLNHTVSRPLFLLLLVFIVDPVNEQIQIGCFESTACQGVSEQTRENGPTREEHIRPIEIYMEGDREENGWREREREKRMSGEREEKVERERKAREARVRMKRETRIRERGRGGSEKPSKIPFVNS